MPPPGQIPNAVAGDFGLSVGPDPWYDGTHRLAFGRLS
jgi:hypothetical protein